MDATQTAAETTIEPTELARLQRIEEAARRELAIARESRRMWKRGFNPPQSPEDTAEVIARAEHEISVLSRVLNEPLWYDVR